MTVKCYMIARVVEGTNKPMNHTKAHLVPFSEPDAGGKIALFTDENDAIQRINELVPRYGSDVYTVLPIWKNP